MRKVDESAHSPVAVGEHAGEDKAAANRRDGHRGDGKVIQSLVYVAHIEVIDGAEHGCSRDHDDGCWHRRGDTRQVGALRRHRTQQDLSLIHI